MSEHMKKRARKLRTDASPPERVLWKQLRSRRLAGHKIKRQVPLGPYVADFLCADAKLVIEIDGRTHDTQAEYDKARDEWMRANGLRVLRISASDVSKDLTSVLERILRAIKQRE